MTPRPVFRFALCAALLLGACALPLRAPLEEVATDLDHYVTDSGWRGDFQISPDGLRLLWIEQAARGEFQIVARRVTGGGAVRVAAGRLASYGVVFRQVAWLGDSRHIAWLRDETGDENTQLWVQDTDAPGSAPRNLTPWPGAKSAIHTTGGPKGTSMRIVSNRRDPRVFDLIGVNYATGESTEVARNPGDVDGWISDFSSGELAARLRADGVIRILEMQDVADGPWRELRRWPLTGSYVRALNRGRKSLILATNQGHNTIALVRVDLETGKETVLFRDPKLDVSRSFYNGTVDRVYAVQTDPGYPRTQILLPDLEAILVKLLRNSVGEDLLGFEIQNTDRSANLIVFKTHTRSGTQELLFERRSARVTVLRDSRNHPLAAGFAISEPVVIPARDGRELHGYLARPPGHKGAPLPLYLAVHGGPWLRMIERQPHYWWPYKETYHRNYGDPGTPAGATELRRISPAHELARIRAPLLIIHGRNDIRVPIEDSDDVHAGLRRLGRVSHYVVFEDEGHSIRRIQNRLTAWRNIDAFLKRCVQ